MRHEDLQEEDWKDEAPLLASLGKDAGPDVPEGYFEGLPESVLSRIRSLPKEEAQETPVIQMNAGGQVSEARPMRTVAFRRTMFWSVAAGIALLATFGTYFLLKTEENTETTYAEEAIRQETMVQLASLDSREITPYLDVTDVSDEQLFAALGSEAEGAFEGEDHEVQQDEAAEYLEDVNLDEIDWQELDIDLEDLQ